MYNILIDCELLVCDAVLSCRCHNPDNIDILKAAKTSNKITFICIYYFCEKLEIGNSSKIV